MNILINKHIFLLVTLVGIQLNVTAKQNSSNSNREELLPIIVNTNDDSNKLPGRSVLKQKNIEQQQADNAANLINILPGVNMAGGFRPGGQTLNINGMGDAEDVRVQLDGATKSFEKYQQGSIFIEPELLRRVTVDKGNYSPQYGNGGFAGTVKFETKDARDFLQENQKIGVFLKYGNNSNNNQKTYSTALVLQNEQKNIDLLLFGSVRNAGDYKRPDNSKILFSKNNQKTGLIKVNWQISPEHLLTLSSVYGIHKGWEPFAAKRDILPKPSSSDIMRYGTDIAWKRKLVYRDQKDENYTLKYNYLPENNPWINLSTQFSYSKTTQNDMRPKEASSGLVGSLGNQSWITYSDLTFDINNTSTFNIKTTVHELLFGLQWLKNTRNTLMYHKGKMKDKTYNYGYFQPYYMPSGRQYTQAFYLQDQIKWKNIIFSTGVRYDHINNIGQKNLASQYNDISVGHNYSQKNYNGWSYYLGLNYDINHYLSLFTNFSRTWRAPVIDEQYETQYSKASVSATSLNLEKEMINQTRVGGIITLNHLFQENDAFQFRATYFYHRGKNEIFKTRGVNCVGNAADTKYVCPKPIGNYRNLPGYVIQGAELEAYYQSTYLFGELTYSYVKGKRDTSPRNPWGKTSTWIAEIPPRKATATLGFNIPKYNFTAGWRAEFVRRQDRSPLSSDPKAGYWSLPASRGYSLHNLFLSWSPAKIKGMNIKITVDNLFNRAYNPYLGELASGTGRNIKFSLSQKF
ncbi:TPA: TonB-dependent hemoglobin/transferrin/lactoferrin family receptor [Haemophilus influenzae]|uniref:Hemin receptor n=1 Tax=Haemophilus influenzae TaxID=727 RepID=G9FZS0_HAEIF|nr:TonB-dependent hemoglobin/transferrin/lactoferrin family receptor [Haemophilus influenzae]AEV42514.1 hemin receptor precursor [Haemophilus influenzae]MCK8930610.1 TonB-dependent hemoglobin/transferrin/lactoferrin family receptor [Haemophilus influenzae]MCK9133088.1 TonB-dependent hemoglobin/transferrin/lactoferrin family receptor [Haemophilus influenzae]MCK9135407.1 TonB-dependent hemoglobin/transferrin/lactoferrin family receptor [Haemophilus influenzae]MCK9137712.1 TonB-dependent hemoglob